MRYCMNHPLEETGLHCSRCKKPVCAACLVPLKGQNVCAECKHATLSRAFRSHPVTSSPATAAPAPGVPPPGAPPAPPAPFSPAPGPVAGAAGAYPPWETATAGPSPPAYALPVLGNCSLHTHSPAYATCERCGDFTCALCVTAFEGRNYCVRCFELMWQRGTLEASRFSESKTAFVFGVLSLFLGFVPFYGVIPCLVACGLGISALRRIAAQPDLPGKKQATMGLVMGAVGLLCGIGVWVWIIANGVM